MRTVLAGVVVLAALLSVVAAGTTRLYRGELVRRTESALAGQGAALQAVYRRAIVEELRSRGQRGDAVESPEEYGIPAGRNWNKRLKRWHKPKGRKFRWTGREVGPGPPEPNEPNAPPDPVATEVGKSLAETVREIQTVARASVTLVDYRGTIVASTDAPVGRSLLHREEIRKALNGKFVQKLRERPVPEPVPPLETIRRRTGFEVCVAVPVVHDSRLFGAALLTKPPVSMTKAVYKHRYLFGGILFVVLAGLVAISTALIYFVKDPVDALLAKVARAESEAPGAGAEIEPSGAREFEHLSDALTPGRSDDSDAG